MEYFDVASFDVEPALAKRLGYRRVFSPSEIAVRETPGGALPYVMSGADPGRLYSAIKDSRCLGVMISENTIIKKTLEQVNTNEKLLVFSASDFANAEGSTLLRRLGRARLLLKFALKAKAELAIASIARDDTNLLSSMQTVAVARLIGADRAHAQRMAHVIGEHYDNQA